MFTATRPEVFCGMMERFRIFRTEKTYAVKTGKWYFEFETVTAGDMRVGWVKLGCQPEQELGSDEQAFVFDGYKVCVSRANKRGSGTQCLTSQVNKTLMSDVYAHCI